jgi:hypothetical protein
LVRKNLAKQKNRSINIQERRKHIEDRVDK